MRRRPTAKTPLSRSERELEALHAIAMKIAAASSIEVICKVAAERVTRILGYSATAVLLLSGGSARNGAASADAGGGGPETLELVATDGPVPPGLIGSLGGPPGPLEQKALKTHRPQVVPELRRMRQGNLQERDRFIEEGFHSAAMIPIVAGRRTWGILGVVAGTQEMLDRRAIGVLSDVARTIGIALEKRRLLDLAHRQVDDVRFFRDVSAWIAGTIDLDVLLSRICRNLTRLVDVTQCFILLHDTGLKQLYGVAATPPHHHQLKEVRIRLGSRRSAAVRCFKTRKPIAIYDAAKDSRANPRLVKLFKETSTLSIPLLVRGEAIGCVMLAETRRLRRFSEEEIARAQTVANQAALAIENALRHRDAVAARDRAHVLLETVRDCSSSVDLHDTMKRVARRTVLVTSATRCTIFMPDEGLKRIHEIVDQGTPRPIMKEINALKGRLIADFPAGKQIVSSRRALVYDDIGAEGGIPAALAKRLGLRGIVIAPVRARGKFLASFAVAYPLSCASVPREEVSLLEGVANQIALAVENGRAFEEIGRQRLALDVLTARMIGAQEEERRRIARELHDGVSQTLTAVKFELERLGRRPGVGEEIQRAVGTLGDAIGEVRQLCMDLRPSQLDHLGLLATVQWFAKSYTARTSIDVRVDAPEELQTLPPEVEINVYRVIQEALSNISKHAEATQATVKIRARRRRLDVTITDDGVGFDPQAARGHADARGMDRGMGLLTMGERAHLLGGELRVRSQEGRGTSIEVSVPIMPEPSQPAAAGAPGR